MERGLPVYPKRNYIGQRLHSISDPTRVIGVEKFEEQPEADNSGGGASVDQTRVL